MDIGKFWEHVDKSAGPDACWLWTAAKSHNGYGRFALPGKNGRKGRKVQAHRLAWTVTNGAIPDGLEACHRCDNPACVNPAHLFIATHLENVRDCINKGRINRPIGEANPRCRLTAEDAKAIRAMSASGVTQAAISRLYGVTAANVSVIVSRKSWKHVA